MSAQPEGGPGAGPTQRAVEIGTAVAMLIMGAVVVVGSLQVGAGWDADGPRSGFFPILIGGALLAASVFNLAAALRWDRGAMFAEWGQLRQVAAVVVPTTIYVFAIGWLGLYVSSILLIAGFMMAVGRYGPVLSVVVAVTILALAFVTFEWWFLVPLPKGPVEDLLGL